MGEASRSALCPRSAGVRSFARRLLGARPGFSVYVSPFGSHIESFLTHRQMEMLSTYDKLMVKWYLALVDDPSCGSFGAGRVANAPSVNIIVCFGNLRARSLGFYGSISSTDRRYSGMVLPCIAALSRRGWDHGLA